MDRAENLIELASVRKDSPGEERAKRRRKARLKKKARAVVLVPAPLFGFHAPWIGEGPAPKSAALVAFEAQTEALREHSLALRETGGWAPELRVSDRVGADPVTVRDFILKRWIPRRERDGLSNWSDDAAVFRNHILGEIGDEPMATVSRARLAALRDGLNVRSALESTDERYMAAKTARNIWGLVAKAFADAAHPDAGHVDPSDATSARLHVRDHDPTAKIKAPVKRGDCQQSALWPNEVGALLSCAGVALHWRVLHAVALYCGLRQSELRALLVGDIDLENGLISVTKKVSRKTGKIGATKSRKVGHCPIEPSLQPLLAALCEGRDPSEKLLWMPPEEDLAAQLRVKHLPAANVSRVDLFLRDKQHQPYTFHGHRHTHLTWRCGRSDNPSTLMGTVLHSDFSTTAKYIDAGMLNALRRQSEKLFAPLPPALVEAARGGIDPERTRALAKKPSGNGGSGSSIAAISSEISDLTGFNSRWGHPLLKRM
jgi:integrase